MRYSAAVSDLLTVSSIDEDPASFVRGCGTVLREYGPLSQDSGNVSWLVESSGQRLFVKTAGVAAPPAPGTPVPYFAHAGRVRLLRNAIELARSCEHRALPTLRGVIESPAGPALVYAAADGDLIHAPAHQRADPASPYRRLSRLPATDLLGVFDTLLEVHGVLTAAGWVAVDLYDGCLIVDFATMGVTVIDLDTYRRGRSVNDMGRMFGATRFMAPEEFVLGATIDERTTVFTLGRLVWHFATRLTEEAAAFCGGAELTKVVQRACQRVRADRYACVADLLRDWNRARG